MRGTVASIVCERFQVSGFFRRLSGFMSYSTGPAGDNRPDHLERTSDIHREEGIHSAVIKQIMDISPTVKKISLHVKDTKFTFKAGQWVDFFISGVDVVGGYSMCSSPVLMKEKSLMDLAIKYSTHAPAHWLHTKAKEGDAVNLRSGGDFFIEFDTRMKDFSQKILFIAGGVGINPLLSMMLYLEDICKGRDDAPPVTLLYSAKTPEELLFKDEISRMTKENKSMKAELLVTSSKDTGNLSQDFKQGRIDRERLLKALKGKEDSLCYICGPGPMIDDMENELMKLGIKKSDILYEKWW